MAPSGAQYEISHGDQRAVAVEVGGGLRTYAVGDRAVLDGYDLDAACDGARCQSLIPWPNRVQDGHWTWDGAAQELALTEPGQHNAIHGLMRWVGWSMIDHADDSVTLSCTVHPQPGYPWTIEARNTWSLGDTGLTVTTTVTNHSDTAAPVAVGFHPYLTVGTPLVDDAVLTLPAATRLLTGDQQIPTGVEAVAGSAFDFLGGRLIGDQAVDFAYTDLDRDSDGRCRLVLADPSGGASVSLWVDESYPYLEVFTGDTLRPDRRRRGLGVEPMSAPPNALATGEAVVAVAPGDHWRGSWGIDPF